MMRSEQSYCIRKLLEFVGENPDREGLTETPKRYLEALKFWTSGYGKDPSAELKCFQDGGENYDELVFQSNITIFSLCEHHLTPFFGVAHIGYIPKPNGPIVGLSKLARVAEIYTRRLTVQERVTTQIVDALMAHLDPIGAACVLQCRHLCMESRGVQKIGTITTTSALRGCFQSDGSARSEFMSLVPKTGIQGPL